MARINEYWSIDILIKLQQVEDTPHFCILHSRFIEIKIFLRNNLNKRLIQLFTKMMWFDTLRLIALWKAYKNNPQSEIKDEIILVICEIKSKLCQNVIENFNRSVDIYRAAGGGHLADIIFGMWMYHNWYLNCQQEVLKMNVNYILYSFEKNRPICVTNCYFLRGSIV